MSTKNTTYSQIFIGSDHGGFELKSFLIESLRDLNYQVVDCGPYDFDDQDDYPQYSFAVAQAVVESEDKALGIVCCKSGGGVTIASNKVKGARAVAVHDAQSAKHAIERNNANVITLSASWISFETALELVKICINSHYLDLERDNRRIAQILSYEKA